MLLAITILAGICARQAMGTVFPGQAGIIVGDLIIIGAIALALEGYGRSRREDEAAKEKEKQTE